MKARGLIFIGLLVLSSGYLLAGIRGSLAGKVTDPQGLAAVSATVTLKDTVTEQSVAARTGHDGRYEFGFVQLGHYQLEASHPDFVPVKQELDLTTSQKTTVNLSFKQVRGPAESVTVSNVHPTIDPRNSTSQVLISTIDFEHMAGASDQIKAILSKTGSAVVSQEHLHIRGAHQVAYEVNGVVLPDLSLFGSLTPFINLRDIRYAEVMTGGLPAEFGNRTGGVLNVVTHSGLDVGGKRGRVEFSGGNPYKGGVFFSSATG